MTTAVGNEGIALIDGREVLLGETPGELAETALRLLREPALCASLSAAGAMVIRERFSENVARDVMLSVLQMDLCRVCGAVSLGRRNVKEAEDDLRNGFPAEHARLRDMRATNQDEALADVMLEPLHGQGVNSLCAAVPKLSRWRIHALGYEDRCSNN